MDSTPNYGFVIPSIDGSDLMSPDLWRTPFGQVDTKVKQNSDAITLNNKAAKGIVTNGYAEITAISTAISTSTPTVVTGLSVTVALVAGRNYEIECMVQPTQSVITDRISVGLYQNGTLIWGSYSPGPTGAGFGVPIYINRKILNAAGASGQIFDFRLGRAAGTGTTACNASSVSPNYISVKDIGAP